MSSREPRRIRLVAADGTALSALHWPAPADGPAIVIVHGWRSRAANHADFATQCLRRGWAALALELRGHGESEGQAGPEMIDDVLAGVDLLAENGHARIGLRGSSLGGFLALHAAARRPVAAVVAICPARPDGLAQRLDSGWPRERPLAPAVARRDGVARGYWHATGDDRVPWGSTLLLAGQTPQPMQLRIALGGNHGSLQHDPLAQEQTLAFLAAHLEPSHP